MKRNIVRTLSLATLISAAMIAAPAQAQTTVATGVIDVTLTLTSACTIQSNLYTATSSPTPGRVINTLSFGSHPSTDTTADGSTSIAYKCSKGSSPKLSFDGGLNHGGTATRKMKLTAASVDYLVSYNLYTDEDASDQIAVNGSIDLVGDFSDRSIDIFAEATIPAGSAIGTYTDKVTVTLTL